MSTDDIRTSAVLPALDDARIDELEETLFRAIADERARAVQARTGRARLRRRAWWAVTAAAAVVVVAAVASPAVLRGLGGGAAGSAAVAPAKPAAPALPGVRPGVGTDTAVTGSGAEQGTGTSGSSTGLRQIVTTATATVQVGDIAAAARRIAETATAAGGYVAGMSVGDDPALPLAREGSSGDPTGASGSVGGSSIAAPPTVAGSGWITVRVPATSLDGVIAQLGSVGTVQASAVNRADVTDQAIDLQARIDALQASVNRLTELMGRAGSVADLVAAETALSERQATLESYQQQLAALKGQVSLSTLTVNLVPKPAAASADPAGFGTGLAAGWAGLVVALNGLVVALGFLLPWLAVAAVATAVVWLVVRWRRRRRRAAAAVPSRSQDDATA